MRFEDIKPNSLVTLELHNGKGRPVTIRKIYVSWISDEKDFIAYDTASGCNYLSKRDIINDNTKIINIEEK